MVRPLVAAGILAITAMVAVAAMPPRVSLDPPRVTPPGFPHASSMQGTNGGRPRRLPPAAEGTGSLKGEVRDERGTLLPGAVVDASHEARGWRTLALADKQGIFRIDRVPAGAVSLIVRRGEIEFTKTVAVTAGKETALVVQAESVALNDVVGGAPPTRLSPRGPVSLVSPAPSISHDLARSVGAAGTQAARVFMEAMPPVAPTSMDAYARVDPSGFRRVADAPLSTFSVDVDTASYSNSRRFLTEGSLPPPDAVRLEEWINYFPYEYTVPDRGAAFRVSTAVTACPWNTEHQLLRVGVRGRAMPRDEPRARNLVFLVDVSGSMMPRDRLPLVKTSLRMLVDQLTGRDRIALVVYAGRTGLVLPSTPGDQKARIHDALQRLEAGGSTNGAGGIQLAYQTAHEGFIRGGVNRVVLATDGDFNVGVTSMGGLTRLIETERGKGVFLSVLGVGRGNLKDATLEQLADRGNGNYAYVDSLQEARRVLVEQVGATLDTIAKDVKLQVEFNPRHVGAYRLLGYENRALETEDFTDDRKDAGEIGAGHTVTALYEIVPASRTAAQPGSGGMRYHAPATPRGGRDDELAAVSVRHKAPYGGASVEESHVVPARQEAPDADTAFASAVAEAALVLRDDPLATSASLAAAVARAEANLGRDPGGWRSEFVRLLHLARQIRDLAEAPPSQP